MNALTLVIGNRNYSSWSLRPWMLLKHLGLAFDEVVLPLDTPEFGTQVAAWSPAHRVPVLADGDLRIWDSLAICEYVHELFPAAKLWPDDRAQRARARSISAEMHSSFAAMRNAMGMDLHGHYPGKGHTPEALADVRRIQTIWHEQLARSGGPFLFGSFTIADAMFAPVTTRFTTYGVDMDATIRAYVDAVQALPAFVAWKADGKHEPELPDHLL